MKKSDAAYILSAVFVALTNFFYCCTMRFHIKLPRYYPLEHTWKWVNEEGVPSQGWYGMQAFAFLTAGIVTAIAYAAIRRAVSSEVNLKPAQIRMCGVITTLIVVVCMGYMLHYEFSRWGVFTSMGL
jgi:uncharacterized protein YjeT (DUF2065 family)